MTKRPSLLSNIVALGVLQASNYLMPLIMAAYTARVLGVEEWGRVALVQGVLGYFGLLTGWGFPWSATRKIAASQDDAAQLSQTVAATVLAQWCLAGLASAALLLLVAFVPFFSRDGTFYLYGIGVLVGGVLFPNWLLNGLERMKEVAMIQIASRAFTLAMVFLIVKRPEDAPLIIAINGAAGLVAGLMTMVWIKRNLALDWRWPTLKVIGNELRDGGTIFASTAAIGLYANLTPVVLGVVLGPAATGYYVLADRIRLAAQSVLAPVSNALFPRMSRLAMADPTLSRRMLRQFGGGIVIMSLLISVALFVMADTLVTIIGGANFRPAGDLLRWLAALPFVMSFSTVIGLQVLLPNEKNAVFNGILAAAASLSLVMIVPTIQYFGMTGAAVLYCSIEGFVSLCMIAYLVRSGFFSGRWRSTPP